MTLKTDKYCITKENLAMHELIGLHVKVVKSSEAGRVGSAGKVVDETRNLLVIEKDGEEKKLPKAECEFEFIVGDEKVLVEGKKISCKPEQRVKIRRG